MKKSTSGSPPSFSSTVPKTPSGSSLPSLLHLHHQDDHSDEEDNDEDGDEEENLNGGEFASPAFSNIHNSNNNFGSNNNMMIVNRKRIKNGNNISSSGSKKRMGELNTVIRTLDEIMIECRIKSNPPVDLNSNIYWYFNQQLLPISSATNSDHQIKGM